MSCDVGKATEGLKNELWRRWSKGKVGEWAVHLIHLASPPWKEPLWRASIPGIYRIPSENKRVINFIIVVVITVIIIMLMFSISLSIYSQCSQHWVNRMFYCLCFVFIAENTIVIQIVYFVFRQQWEFDFQRTDRERDFAANKYTEYFQTWINIIFHCFLFYFLPKQIWWPFTYCIFLSILGLLSREK